MAHVKVLRGGVSGDASYIDHEAILVKALLKRSKNNAEHKKEKRKNQKKKNLIE